MLWFDGEDGNEMPRRVRSVARYYQGKYGRTPNVCFVHPASLAGPGDRSVDGVEVRACAAVLPGHLWMGVDDQQA